MNAASAVDTAKIYLVPVIAGSVPLILWLLTRRSARADQTRTSATQVEQLYIGEAGKLIGTLQEELRHRNGRVGALEGEREQLRSALQEERQCFEQVRQRHRDVVALLDAAKIAVPDELRV